MKRLLFAALLFFTSCQGCVQWDLKFKCVELASGSSDPDKSYQWCLERMCRSCLDGGAP